MFWDTIETVQERSLQQIVEDPTTKLDEILTHDYCFQELRLESKYLVDYFTNSSILEQLFDRSLFFRPSADDDPLIQYKMSPRSLAILTMGCKPLNNAILADSDLVDRLIKYLEPAENSYDNDITTGFYKRLIIALLNTFDTTENLFLDTLENSAFMKNCFNSIKFGAIAELIVRIPTHCTNLDFQKRIFDWYQKEGVADRLLKLYTKDASMDVLENAGFMWSEFSEMQLRHVDTADSFTNSLYSVDIVKGLVERAFPSLENCSPMLINYITPILVSFVELNRSENEPAFKAFPDLYMREPTLDLGDPDYKFQSAIVSRSKTIMQVIFKAWEAPVADGLTLTAVSCLRLIRALTNTNHLQTHNELAKVFCNPDTSILKLLDYSSKNPTSSICNNHIMAIIAHIILSNTEAQHVLIDSLFKSKPTIITYLINVLKKHENKADDTPTLQHLALQSFFLKIAEYINIARTEGCERSVYLNELIQSQDDADKWNEMSNSILHSFTESNKTYSLSSTQMSQNINEKLGDIDEIVETTEKNVQALTI